MEIVVNCASFVKQLNEVHNVFDLITLCRSIAKESSLQIKKKLLEMKCELHAENILGPRWQRKKPATTVKYACMKCGELLGPNEIKRNGHYKKGLNFDEGYATLNIPLLVHKDRGCLGTIQVNWPFLEKRKRFWIDNVFNVVGYYFEGIGLRGIQRIFMVRQGSSIGIMSIWRMIQRTGKTLRTCCPLPVVNNVKAIGLDEIFMRLRIFRGKGKKALKKVLYGLLVKALGVGQPLLNFKMSLKRDEKSWQEVVDELFELGINYATGLRLAIGDGSEAIANAILTGLPRVAFQECVFHIQKDLLKLLKDKYGSRSKRIKRIFREAKKVFRATDLNNALRKIDNLSSVSKLAFKYLKGKIEHMLTYLQKHEGLPASQSINTNNGMERENRELKKRLLPIGSFKSIEGAENFAAIMLRRESARLQGQPWLEDLFKEISTSPRPITKPPPDKGTTPCLTSAQVDRMVGIKGKANKQINCELPIIRTSNFGLTLKDWVGGYSIFED